jgi:predicted nucleotidyltransferase
MALPPSAAPSAALLAELRAALTAFPRLRLAMLFGSQARGTAGADSDVDVAVVAPDTDVLAISSAVSLATGRDVDVIALGDDPGVPLLEELLRDAVPLYQAEPGAYALWRSHAFALVEIDGPAYVRQRDAWLARVASAGL